MSKKQRKTRDSAEKAVKMPEIKDIEDTQKKLQKLVGARPKIKVEKFKNWGGTQTVDAVFACSPETVEDVQALIKGAKQLGLQVRAAGRTHSWTPLFTDLGQVLVYVKDLKRPDGPQIQLIQDGDDRYVTMASGVDTGAFKAFQDDNGVCLPTNVVLDVVLMGGVVATACHGTGYDVPTVSDYVVSMRIVDSNGDLRTYTAKDDQDMMNAVNCHFGLWGIMIDFTIKVSPQIIVETDNQWIPVEDLFYNQDRLKTLIHDNWSIQLFWFPFNSISKWESVEAFMTKDIDLGEWDPKKDLVWVRVINKPEKTEEILEKEEYERANCISAILAKGYDLSEEFITNFPSAAPMFSKLMTSNLQSRFGNKVQQQLPHAVHFQTHIDTVPVSDVEWAFDLDDDCSNLMTAIQNVIDLVFEEALAGRFPMNLPLELRVIGYSNINMAPAICANPKWGGSGHTCYIEVLAITPTPGFEDFATKVVEFWKNLRGARPHWNKSWDYLPGIDEFIQKAYSDQIPLFLKALERSGADPTGMFFNNRLESIFYPGGHPGRKDKDKPNTKTNPEKRNERSSSSCVII